MNRKSRSDGLSSSLSSGQALSQAIRELAAAVSQLAQAIRQGVPSRTPSVSLPHAPSLDVSLADAVNAFLVAKARTGRSERYLRQVRVVLASVAKGRGTRPLGMVLSDDVESWLNESGWAARTRFGYAKDVRTLFAWCVRKGWIQRNPAEGLDFPRRESTAPGIHTPEQVAAVLETARRLDRQVMRHLALCYFAGVRTAEGHRLREDDIRGGFIHVEAAKSKTRARRLVRIRPALAAWLEEGGTLGPMSPNRVRAVVRESGVPWPPNVARHSFVSYAVAAEGGSASAVALEAGHSEAILFRHYRAVVTESQAAAFWNVRPERIRPAAA